VRLAENEMFANTDTSWAPWHVIVSNDKKKTRLNVISHLLSQVPYKAAPREKVTLPKRQKAVEAERLGAGFG
jgi:hypothetical protein